MKYQVSHIGLINTMHVINIVNDGHNGLLGALKW